MFLVVNKQNKILAYISYEVLFDLLMCSYFSLDDLFNEEVRLIQQKKGSL